MINKVLIRLLLSTFMDNMEEWHAFVIGFGDGFAFTRTDILKFKKLKRELHYYKFGLFLGRLSILGYMAALVKAII